MREKGWLLRCEFHQIFNSHERTSVSLVTIPWKPTRLLYACRFSSIVTLDDNEGRASIILSKILYFLEFILRKRIILGVDIYTEEENRQVRNQKFFRKLIGEQVPKYK